MTQTSLILQQISENLFRFEEACNVYIVRSGDEAVLIDFGAGDVLDVLASIGVSRVTDVLMTHHHRDQGQGLPRAVAAGARVWVPYAEQDLFQDVEAHWQSRAVLNNYNMRQDRFALLEPVPIAGTLHDYGKYTFGGQAFTVLPTPGHTTGSISLLAEIDGRLAAFTGDLIAAPGKVWSMAATQWTYNGAEGVAASIASLLDLKAREPGLLLPSHGLPIATSGPAIDLLVERFRQLLIHRRQNPRLFQWLEQPYEALTPHLLRNRTSLANSHVLVSESGKALFIDFGYDFMTGMAAGSDRASRRPWLYSLRALKRDFGVTQVDAALPTHYHDDHVAGLNLLREVEGTRVWAAENFAPILQQPERYDLPCLWYDPIAVDQVLPLEQAVQWEEYTLTLHPQPGHTLYAVAISFEVDGRRVLAIGDQYEGEAGDRWNYVYQNRFRISDYRESAELYRRLQPDLIISGHSAPKWVQPDFINHLLEEGEVLERLHRELLPLELVDFGAEGFGARIQPYQSRVRGGECVLLEVETHNPYPQAVLAMVRLTAPPGWSVEPPEAQVELPPKASACVGFAVTPPAGLVVRRARLAADLTVDGHRFGQQAEALVTVTG